MRTKYTSQSCHKNHVTDHKIDVQIATLTFGMRSDRFLPLPIPQGCVISAIAKKSTWDRESYTVEVGGLVSQTPLALCLRRMWIVSPAIEGERRARLPFIHEIC